MFCDEVLKTIENALAQAVKESAPECSNLVDLSNALTLVRREIDSDEPAPNINIDSGLWFQSAVSGLWYHSRGAAGDVQAVRIDGVTYRPINPKKPKTF